MERKRLVVSYNNVTEEVLEAIRMKYPLGYTNHVMKVKTQGDDFFYAITVDTDNASYLVKVPVKIDTKGSLNEEDTLGEIAEEKEAEDNFPEADTTETED
ncbi:MAG: hypothetical protein WCQ70_01925 [Lentimicrobiaceae bacterium]